MTALLAHTWWWVALTVAFTVIGQSLQKRLAVRAAAPPGVSPWRHYLRQRLFWAGLAALGVGFLCWLRVLADLPVGKAYPLLGANYVAMLVVARVCFGERVPGRRWAGVGLIVVGLALVSGS